MARSNLDDSELRFRALAALAELQDPRALPHVRAVLNRWLMPAFERTQDQTPRSR